MKLAYWSIGDLIYDVSFLRLVGAIFKKGVRVVQAVNSNIIKQQSKV